MKDQGNKGAEGKKIFLIGLGLTAAGMLGIAGWDYFKKLKIKKEQESYPESAPVPSLPSSSVNQDVIHSGSSKPKAINDFPLKQGSRGERVVALQQALIEKYGKSVLSKHGADGIFGAELVAALKSKGLPENIDENMFNVLVKSKSLDARTIAGKIFDAAGSKNLSVVLSNLKLMKSTEDYSAVNRNFMLLRLEGGVRQTLVNALMKAFSGDQKQKIQFEFLRMGLKFDGNKWSLSGIPLKKIITTAPTLVWKDKNTTVKVPSNMILGYELNQQDGFSLFQSLDGQQFFVKTQTIRYI